MYSGKELDDISRDRDRLRAHFWRVGDERPTDGGREPPRLRHLLVLLHIARECRYNGKMKPLRCPHGRVSNSGALT